MDIINYFGFINCTVFPKTCSFVIFRWKCGLDGILVRLVTLKELVSHWTADELIVVKLTSTHS
jgi:hypothetical protein